MTKNRIAYLFTVLCLFLFFVYCNSYIALFALQLTAAVTAVSGLLAFAASREVKVSVSRTASSADPVKRRIEFCMVIENGSFLPVPIVGFTAEIRDVSENGAVYRKIRTSAGSRDKRRIYISLSAPYAAYIEASVGRVRVCDCFGVFSFPVKQSDTRAQILISPSVQRSGGAYEPSRRTIPDSDVYSDTEKGSDRSQVFELREYREGDDLRNVHWGLSSKTDTLIVKEFSKPIDETCAVLLEISLGGDSAEKAKQRADRVLSVFISLMTQLLSEGQPCEVCFYSPTGKRLAAFDVSKLEDTAAVMKAFLSEKLPSEPLLTFNAYAKGSAFYYIYDSTAAAPDKALLTDLITPIDAAKDDHEDI